MINKKTVQELKDAGLPKLFGLLKKQPVNQFWITKITCAPISEGTEGMAFDERLLTNIFDTPVKHVAERFLEKVDGLESYEQTYSGNANNMNYWVFCDKVVNLFNNPLMFVNIFGNKNYGFNKARFNNRTINKSNIRHIKLK